MSEVILIIEQLKKELEKEAYVKAFALVGSQARETVYKANKYSDLEVYVVVEDDHLKEIEKKLPNITNNLGDVLFSFNHQIGFVVVYNDLFRVEISLVKLSEISSIFNRPKAQVVKVLFDRTDGELEKVLDKRPDELDYAKSFKDLMTNFWYWQIIGVQYFKKGEIYNTRAILNIHASAFIKLCELLNDPNIILLETNKRVEQFLTEEQINQLKELTVSYNSKDIKEALIKVMDIFSNTAKEVKNKYSYEFDKSIEQKVKSKLINLLD